MSRILIARPRVVLPARVEAQMTYDKLQLVCARYVKLWQRYAWRCIVTGLLAATCNALAVAAALHGHKDLAMVAGMAAGLAVAWITVEAAFGRDPQPLPPPPNELL